MEDEKVEDGVLSEGSESFDNDWVGSEDENENEAAEPEVNLCFVLLILLITIY